MRLVIFGVLILSILLGILVILSFIGAQHFLSSRSSSSSSSSSTTSGKSSVSNSNGSNNGGEGINFSLSQHHQQESGITTSTSTISQDEKKEDMDGDKIVDKLLYDNEDNDDGGTKSALNFNSKLTQTAQRREDSETKGNEGGGKVNGNRSMPMTNNEDAARHEERKEMSQLVKIQKIQKIQDELWFDEQMPTNHRFKNVKVESGRNNNNLNNQTSVLSVRNGNGNSNKNTNSSASYSQTATTTAGFNGGHSHDSGNFRNRISSIWDPHPEYKFNAFGIDFHLKLTPSEDSSAFGDIAVTTHSGNFTSRRNLNDGEHRCFYNGIIVGDEMSLASVSLCGGMTGHLRSKNGSFFIQPAEEWSPLKASSPLLHVIYRVAPLGSGHEEDYLEPAQPPAKPLSPARQREAAERAKLLSKGPNINGKKRRRGADVHFDVEVDADEEKEPPEEKGNEEDEDGYERKKGRRRVKRSMSSEKYIEMMVVADESMVNYHKGNLKHYVLTLLSIVSLVFKDGSIGNPVNIALVNFHVLKDRDFSSGSNNETVGISASDMLRNFCKWQQEMNDLDDSSVGHHDVAVLLTRLTICRNPWSNKCDTLGLAELGTICDVGSNCAIIQDNGLSAAFTISHEIGHVLSMPHDDDYKCASFTNSKHHHYVMSRMLDQNTYPWVSGKAWSRCSRHYLTEFLDAGHGFCLEDQPNLNLLEKNPFTLSQPGEIFSEHDQCSLVFGESSKLCSYMPVCRRLWCSTGEETEGCRTQHMPWADGTPCQTGKWCLRGACVLKDLEKMKIIDGHWGAWQEYGECSRLCGGGVRKSLRECDSPSPSNGGKYCVGPRVRYISCNTHECNSSSQDFRAEQCSKFNNDNFNIQGLPKNVQWVPKYSGISPKDRCKLFCRVLGSSAYYLLREKVIDGTTCGPDTYDICVNGVCLPAGCDRRLHSRKTLDICSVCGGDGGSCQTIGGAYNKSQYGYSDVVRIPLGATNLDVRQVGWENDARDDNYLAILDPSTSEYILNGNFVVSMFRKTVHAAGTILEYSGSDSIVERINSSRPLKSDLIIQVLSVGKLHPPNIRFQYVISTKKSYKWISHWQPCSRLCDGSHAQRQVCIDGESPSMAVDDSNCSNKPSEHYSKCNEDCRLEWRCNCNIAAVKNEEHEESDYDSENSLYAGYNKMHAGYASKHYQCVREFHPNNVTVEYDEHCTSIPKPSCNCEREEKKKKEWIFGAWSECSEPCGEGYVTRKVSCPSGDCEGTPLAKKKCWGGVCGSWRITEWSPCSRTCGEGRIKALYACYLGTSVLPPNYCQKEPTPTVERACEGPPCYFWDNSDFSECHCPNRISNRTVDCRSKINSEIIDDSYCLTLSTKPEESKPCVCAYREPDNSVDFHPKFSPLVWNKWQTGQWSECDSTNKRQRMVACSENPCTNQRKPEEFQDCGTWWTGGWSNCNATCGEGHEIRIVRCIDKNRQDLEEERCRPPQPEKSRVCASYRCEKKKRGFSSWKVGDFSACSKPCNGGVQNRQVVCPNENCNEDDRPETEEKCNEEPCLWKTSNWSKCIKCKKTRMIHCSTQNGTIVEAEYCANEIKPEDSSECKCRDRPRWKVGLWQECSKKCGRGKRIRSVACVKNDDIIEDDVKCEWKKKPKIERRCGEKCPNKWVTSVWSDCSKSCGYGIQQRTVTCHNRNKYGWLDPLPTEPVYCKDEIKPKTYKYCLTSDCDSEYTFFSTPWSECPDSECNKRTRQRRRAYCVRKSTGEKVRQKFCRKENRPQRKRRCPFKACGFNSCKEVNSLIDGEYTLSVGGKNISIYCHNMASAGREYITLHNIEENYSEYYNKRLIRPESCPEKELGVVRVDNCECIEDRNRKAGFTFFHKIKINVTTLVVQTDDFTFSSTSSGSNIKYGHAGDCYSSASDCPQGKFSINLNGTGFALHESVKWTSQGHKASMRLNKSEDSLKMVGHCGGFCGSCSSGTLRLQRI